MIDTNFIIQCIEQNMHDHPVTEAEIAHNKRSTEQINLVDNAVAPLGRFDYEILLDLVYGRNSVKDYDPYDLLELGKKLECNRRNQRAVET